MKTTLSWPWALVVSLLGCESYAVVVESNTSWEGDVCDEHSCANQSSHHLLHGSGNKSFDQGTELINFDTTSSVLQDQICYWFGNTTDSGYVRVYIKHHTDILGTSEHARHETSAPHGAVSECYTK